MRDNDNQSNSFAVIDVRMCLNGVANCLGHKLLYRYDMIVIGAIALINLF